MMPASLGQPYDYAIERLQAAGGDVALLPLPLQTLLLIESAQGIIETGGLEFFYEADFPNHPPYALFVEAYRRIGADASAHCIEATAQMFPFEEPQLFEELRLLWLEKLQLEADQEFARMSAEAGGDDTVWPKLAGYVERHREAFAPAAAEDSQ